MRPKVASRANDQRKTKETRQTDEMFKLGEAVFLEGVKRLEAYKLDEPNFIHLRSQLIIRKRLAVVEFVNGLELILKAIMIRNRYSIYRIRNDRALKLEEKVKDIVDEGRTIDLDQVVAFFRSHYPGLPFGGVDELRKLRNQIVHKGTGIGMKKRTFFLQAIDCLIGVYASEQLSHRKFLQRIQTAKTRF